MFSFYRFGKHSNLNIYKTNTTKKNIFVYCLKKKTDVRKFKSTWLKTLKQIFTTIKQHWNIFKKCVSSKNIQIHVYMYLEFN